jgi:hypothetical protein
MKIGNRNDDAGSGNFWTPEIVLYNEELSQADRQAMEANQATYYYIAPNVTPSVAVAITSGSQTTCAGTSVTFTATPSNGGTPTYVWKNNNNIIGGETSSTYTTTSLANGDVITCELTSSLFNAYPNTGTSTGITMTVNPNAPPSVSITASPSGSIVTSGSNVTFTATAGAYSGAAPTYQWGKNSMPIGGAINSTYSTSTLANGDVISCTLTYTGTCLTTTTSSGGITMTVNPLSQNGLNFDSGADELVDCGNAASLQLSTGTIEAWIKTTDAGPSYRGIVVKQLAYGLFLVDNTLNAFDWVNGGTSTGVNLADGQWHHVALSFQPTDGQSKVYIDGVPVLTIPSAFTISDQGTPLLIGAGVSSGEQSFAGTIDGVRVWNTARTDAEMLNNYTCQLTGNESGLVAYYNFNQGVAASDNTGLTVLVDATTNANHGTLTYFALTGATSNWVLGTSSVGAPVTPSVSIAALPSGAIVAGTNVTFTASPTNGGAAPTYVWKKSGIVIDGEVSATYTSTTLANGDIITCEMTSNAGCTTTATASSTGITMSVTSTYTWTGATSTDWATATNWTPNGIPSSTDNVIIPTTTNKPMLPANQTIANLSLTGNNKIMLGNNTLCVNAITGGSSSSYVVTNGTGGLLIKGISTTPTVFPVGPSESAYTPATITNNVARDFTVKVGTTLTNAAALTKTVNLQWDITPSVLTGNSATLALGWSTANQGSGFNPNAAVEIAHYNPTLSIWDRFRLATVTGSNPYVATVSGVDAFSPFVVANQNALSVELLDFKGTPQYNGNLLTWTTANEVNNKGFNVERLMDNGQWITLGFVNAKSKAASYDFTDNTPLSTSYYRLRQIDNDGKETLSKVVTVSRNPSTKLKVYPNPVSNVLTIEAGTNEVFQILNLLGQQVLTGKTPPLGAGGLDVSALPQGAYFLKVGTEQVKFVKQ